MLIFGVLFPICTFHKSLVGLIMVKMSNTAMLIKGWHTLWEIMRGCEAQTHSFVCIHWTHGHLASFTSKGLKHCLNVFFIYCFIWGLFKNLVNGVGCLSRTVHFPKLMHTNAKQMLVISMWQWDNLQEQCTRCDTEN